LALSVAREKDWSVVLVDVDCAKQHITSMFSAENEPGLLDLLKDPSLHPDDVIMPTNVPSLSILPAGNRDQNAAELLASERMDQLAEVLSEEDKFRLVIMDSSPLLLTTEALVLSSHVGQIALVVHAGHTAQSAVTAAIKKIDSTKAVNAILNRSESEASTPYGSYYGYYVDDTDEYAGSG
jgi:protein-tyrosine kinase